jgi:HEAT repeat protein
LGSLDWWDRNAVVFFGPKEKTLIIRLRWGRILMVELDDGDVMDEEWYEDHKRWYIKETEWKKLHAFAREHSAKLAVSMLGSKDSFDRETGAVVVGQMKCRGAIPKLRTLLDDPNVYWRTGDGSLMTTVYYVRKAAKQALEAMGEEVKGVVVEEPEKK